MKVGDLDLALPSSTHIRVVSLCPRDCGVVLQAAA